MSETPAQIWKGAALSVERKTGQTSGTAVLHFSGPFTARDMYNTLPPAALEEIFDSDVKQGEKPTTLVVVDLTEVPYMDSTGLGMIVVAQYVRCKGKGAHLIAVGMTPRASHFFELTKMNSVLPMAATVEEAMSR